MGADDRAILDQIIDSLTSIAKSDARNAIVNKDTNRVELVVGKVKENGTTEENGTVTKTKVLILGAGRVCQPAAELLSSIGSISSRQWHKSSPEDDFGELSDVHVIVASLYLKEAEEVQ